jgi:hypothetical protein
LGQPILYGYTVQQKKLMNPGFLRHFGGKFEIVVLYIQPGFIQ